MTDIYDRQGNPIDHDRWLELLVLGENYKRVAQDQVGPYWISTVWLGLDHSFGGQRPLIFETMVFAPDDDEGSLGPDIDMSRYSTEEEALAGHSETVTLIRGLTIGYEEVLPQEEESHED